MRIILKEEATRTVAVVELKLVKKEAPPVQAKTDISEASEPISMPKEEHDPLSVLKKIQNRAANPGVLDSVHAAGAKMMKELIQGLKG